jgi:hypothetical protein
MQTVIVSALRVVDVWEDTGMNALRSVFPELATAIDRLEDAIRHVDPREGGAAIIGCSARPARPGR